MSSQRTPTGELREEHRLILQVADSLDRLVRQPQPDLAAWHDCALFLRGFADACHHGKEEDVLFEALTDAGMPRDEGPIAVMLYEHSMGRALVSAMTHELTAPTLDDQALARLRSAGRDYVDLIRAHIAKEDGVLFDLADDILDAPACARVCDHYDDVCGKRFEGKTIEQLREIAARLASATSGDRSFG